MKIQILNADNISECIDGYTPVILNDNKINLDAPDNSISEILCYHSIENIPYHLIDSTISNIVRLLRLNGKLTIIGLEVNAMCRDLINKVIDCETYNNLVYNKRGIYDVQELSTKLTSAGLTIDKLLLKGAVYELHASRSN